MACIRPRRRFRAIVLAMGFECAYRNGTPPWDIGRAQPVIVRLGEGEQAQRIAIGWLRPKLLLATPESLR